MGKEQKKLLLVAVSVGVFLLVTITTAIILITQKSQPQEAAISWSTSSPVHIPSNPPVIEPQIDTSLNGDDSDITAAIDINDGDNLIIQIPSPIAPAVPDNPEIVTVAPRTPPAVTPPAAPERRAVQPPAQQAPSAPTTRTAARSPSRTINDYWIQTGAFSARIRAEDAKENLAEKGLVSIIENREINGQLWYRVRLGPYTSEQEANYWLALVKSIDGFGESQVRQTARTQ